MERWILFLLVCTLLIGSYGLRRRSNLGRGRGSNDGVAVNGTRGALAWSFWEREDGDFMLDAMSGYTDCSRQSPPVGESQTNDAWWRARSGRHRPGRPCDGKSFSCNQPFRVPVVGGLGFCLVPKNGCTFWKALFMRMDGNPLWNSTDIMDLHKPHKVKLEQDERLLNTPSGLVVMVVRNPIARVLSAWLDKRGQGRGDYQWWFDTHPGTRASFAKFIKAITPEVNVHRADHHWAQQSDHCRLPSGAQYDIYLKAECRTLWGPSLFEYKGMERWTDSGWGSSGADPFIRDERHKAIDNASRSFEGRNFSKQRHSTGASGLSKICKFYTRELFWAVTELYFQDIKRFGYAEDCRRIASHCGF